MRRDDLGQTGRETEALLKMLDRVGSMHLTARALVEGVRQGRHAAGGRDASGEYFDSRMYLPGDDPRRMDWRLFGRSDRMYIRRFRRFTDLALHVIVDASATMDYTGYLPAEDAGVAPLGACSKYRYAAALGAALCYVAIRNGDRAALSIAGGAGADVQHFPARSSRSHLHVLLHALDTAQPGGPSRLVETIMPGQQHGWPRRRLVVILSDLLIEPETLWRCLLPLQHDRCDLTGVQILSHDELHLPGALSARFVDVEQTREVAAFIPEVREDYLQRLQAHVESIRQVLSQRGMRHRLVHTRVNPVEALRVVIDSSSLTV